MMEHPWSQEMTWAFVQTNWQMILKNLGEFQGIPSIIGSLGAFCSASERPQRSAPSSRRTQSRPRSEAIQQAIERIENCVALKERQANRS